MNIESRFKRFNAENTTHASKDLIQKFWINYLSETELTTWHPRKEGSLLTEQVITNSIDHGQVPQNP